MKLPSRIYITSLCTLFLLCCATRATGQENGFYVKADLGGGVTMDTDLNEFFGPVAPGSKVKFDPGFRYGFAAGYQITDWFALEGELGAMSSSINEITDASHVDAWFINVPFLVNAKFQYRNASHFTPYIGAGVGGADSILDVDFIELNGVGMSGTTSEVVFAWQGFAGVRYNFNDQMSLGLEYRYTWSDKPSWEVDETFGTFTDHLSFGEIQSHSLSLAFQWRF
jgi:OOP family OmpA-OmpF porin